MKRITSRLLTGAAGIAVAAGLALGGGIAANAASSTPSSSPTPSSTTAPTGVPFRAVSAKAIRAQFGTVPATLHSDLKALKGKKGSERHDAERSIESKALAGSYGTDVKDAATAAKSAWKSAPSSLKGDLKAARTASKSDRPKDLAAIESNALAGYYGSAIQEWARTVHSNIEKQQAATLGATAGSII